MNVYKQMRQQHQKQLLQLENKLKNEMNEHKRQLDREYEQQVHQFEKEMEKLKSKHKTDFDQKVSTQKKEKFGINSMLWSNCR